MERGTLREVLGGIALGLLFTIGVRPICIVAVQIWRVFNG